MTNTANSPAVSRALERLSRLHPKLIDLGLDRTFRILEKCGNPHLSLPPVIHVAGTNGKGSVLAFLRAMLEAAGLRVHAYTSPHLVRFHERIRLAGELISDDELIALLEEVEHINGRDPITFFEVTTAAAMLAFSRSRADVVLLETGLGGRADSTNVIPKPLATVITPIARDHEHFLGNTLGAIALEKAGILRPDVPVFSATQEKDAAAVIEREAQRLGSPLITPHHGFTLHPRSLGIDIELGPRRIAADTLGLMGPHQQDNAGLAVAVLASVFPEISSASIARGLANAIWPGRVQHLAEGRLRSLLPEGCQLWLDGAHNAHGARALATTLGTISDAPWILVTGALNTRPPRDFLDQLKPSIMSAITLTIPGQEASLNAITMAEAARDCGIRAVTATSIEDALEKAATIRGDSRSHIVIAGSLYLAGHVLDVNETPPR
ncbi:folylpolyglutamate synthase/dihydrofolate synthase family protein [Alphaproteobacteria bacterium LSUCC0684]